MRINGWKQVKLKGPSRLYFKDGIHCYIYMSSKCILHSSSYFHKEPLPSISSINNSQPTIKNIKWILDKAERDSLIIQL